MRFWLAAALLPALPAEAQTAAPWTTQEVQERVSALAFDPARFLAGQDDQRDLVRLSYTGDDWDWPVWSILIRDSCGSERPWPRECLRGRIAWMVRAPVPERGAERPRWRGSALVGTLTAKKIGDRTALVAGLDAARLDWVQADLSSCPGAMAAFGKITEAKWIDSARIAPDSQGDLNLVLHADRIKVEVPYFMRTTTYQGWIAPGSPAEWANDLAKTLEPCWRPASAPPPWRLPPKAVD
jgi:hypothetical protein